LSYVKALISCSPLALLKVFLLEYSFAPSAHYFRTFTKVYL
jgi:hypothetical protein